MAIDNAKVANIVRNVQALSDDEYALVQEITRRAGPAKPKQVRGPRKKTKGLPEVQVAASEVSKA